MNLAPTELDPGAQVYPETLGRAPAAGRLAGRRVLVVGAGQRRTVDVDPPIGNGRAIAALFAREGAAVACLDRDEEAAQATVDLIARAAGHAFPLVADVTVPAAVTKAVDDTVARLGGLDGLVLNVGISTGKRLLQQTPEDWDAEYAVNVRSHMLFAQRALAVMAPGSSIVLMSSLASQRANGRNPAYESSKAAQLALARSIAREGEPTGIRCNAIAPGLMDTPMGRDASRHRTDRAAVVPFGRQGTGWEVAYAALYLISHESSYVNAHCLVVDGGLGVGIARSRG